MTKAVATAFAALILAVSGLAQETRIYWGNDVPPGWNGHWDAKFHTVPEKTGYSRTTSSYDLHEFVDTLKWNSENMHVFRIFTSAMRKVAPAIVLANPRVATPEDAVKSGKPVIYLQGNIHPPEAEGTEALLMVMRDILLGSRKHLLDNQILIICPVFNVDGTDTFSTRDGTPHIIGTRRNSADMDLNRDAIKLQTTEVRGLHENVINRWDPVLLFDAHAMGRVKHGYAIVYATSTVPAAHPSPRGYVWDTLFPSVRSSVRKNFGLETFSHCMFDEDNWPPTVWSHDRAFWTVEAKFLANGYGLRNRMSILVETPGHPSFERRIYAQYAYIAELLEYTNTHGREMMEICKQADEDTVRNVRDLAESGELMNYVQGKYESRGKIDLLAYERNEATYLPGTSVMDTAPGAASGPPEVIPGVEHLTKSVGTKEAVVPRGYLIPAELRFLVEKLEAHNIQVQVLEQPLKVAGEEFVVDRLVKERRAGYDMTSLEGGFFKSSVRTFPAGTYRVDLEQPLANLTFYCLEPEAADGFVGWGLLDEHLKALGVEQRSIVYPIFKYLQIVQ
jgi:hypothetical protein